MNVRRLDWVILISVLLSGLCTHAGTGNICLADEVIEGRGCYTYGDNETLIEARSFATTLAMRNAIESYLVYVESLTTVSNYKLKKDEIETISGGYLKNIRIISHTENNRTICEIIQAVVTPSDVLAAIKKVVNNKNVYHTKKTLENSYVKIIDFELNKLSWLSILYQSKINIKEKYTYSIQDYRNPEYTGLIKLIIHCFDNNNNPLPTTFHNLIITEKGAISKTTIPLTSKAASVQLDFDLSGPCEPIVFNKNTSNHLYKTNRSYRRNKYHYYNGASKSHITYSKYKPVIYSRKLGFNCY